MKVNKEVKGAASADPVKKEAPSTELGEIRFVPLEQIVNHKDLRPPKTDPEHVETLRKDIAQRGLLANLVVWNGGNPDNQVKVGGNTFPATYLIAGAHRKAALKEMQLSDPKTYAKLFGKGIPVRVISGTIRDAICARINENVDRRHMSAEEILPYLQYLQDMEKMSGKEIAKRLSKTEAWVSQILNIPKQLGKKVTEDVIEGKVSLGVARDAAAEVAKKKKAGEKFDQDDIEKTVKEKAEKRESVSRKGAKQLLTAYRAMPRITQSAQVKVLTDCLVYLAGETDTLPSELSFEKPVKKETVKVTVKK